MQPASKVSMVEWIIVILAAAFALGSVVACWVWLGDVLSIPAPG